MAKKKNVSEDSKELKKKAAKAPAKKAAKKAAAPKGKGKGKGKSAKAPAAPSSKKGDYKLIVSMNDETFEAQTDDIASAIMELKPGHLKTKVVITVKYGDMEKDFVLFNVRAKRIFINRMAAEFFAKSVKLAVNGN